MISLLGGGGGGGAVCTAVLAGGIGAAFEADWLFAFMLRELESFAELPTASESSEARALRVFFVGRAFGVSAGGVLEARIAVSGSAGGAATAASGFAEPTCMLLMTCFSPATAAA